MVESQGLRAAIYARVSSEQQAQQKTIDSQVAALEERVVEDGFVLDDELRFVDDGCSGSTLVRPALERLRDCAYAGGIDRLYVHSPDRLARKYAYQVLLLDELTHYGIKVVFLNHALGTSPEEDLLLQVQGMISEYERAKIMERSRRGKRHAARRGSANVLSGAPYGYRYVSKQEGNGEAHYRIVFEQARIAREMFEWYGVEGVSIGEICRRMKAKGIHTRTGKASWDRATVWGMLKNPAYKGSAGFGKTRLGPRKPALRPQRGNERSQRHYSVYPVPEEEQERIPVPAIVSEDLFAAVQDRLVENKRHSRQRKRGARYLLQGLTQCQCCKYAYYGKPVSRSVAKGKTRRYAYYRCVGTDAYRFGGERICWNKQVRTDLLETAVWEDVCALLQDPDRVRQEYERRLNEEPKDQATETAQLSAMIQRLKRGIARLIDAYEDGLLTKEEFEPRLRNAKGRLGEVETQLQAATDQAAADHELRLVIGQFEEFAERVRDGLQEGDWTTRREIIRALVKRIEIGPESIRVVYMVAPAPFVSAPDSGGSLQDCWRRERAALRSSFRSRFGQPVDHHSRVQERSQQFQQPLVFDPTSHAAHQHVVVDAVEKLLQVHVDHPRVALFQVLLGLGHRLVGRPTRPETETVFRKRLVPLRREHLENRLLDHAIHRRGNAKLPHSPVRLGDLHTLYRLGTIGSRQKLPDESVAMTLEVLFEPCHTHPVHAGGAAVGDHFRHRHVEVCGVADRLHQPVATRRALGTRVRRGRHSPFLAGHRRFTPTLPREGEQLLLFLFPPFAVHESSDLLAAPFTPLNTGDRSGLQRAAAIV